MDEQMNNNGYQYQPNPSPMPNQNKDGIAIAVFVLGIVSICLCCIAWGVISLACAIVSLVLYSRSKTMFSPQKKGMATAGFITSIIGCVLGYFVALNQMNQLSDPEYIAFWTSQNMSVPEPLGFTRSILSFGLIFAGIPTGLIFYSGLVKKWLTPIAPKIIIGFVTFPIYTLAGVIGSIPFIIYKGIFLFKNNRCK